MYCKVCGFDDLSPDDFYKGNKSTCKKCRAARVITWRRNNPSKRSAIQKRYRDKNKEKQKAYYRMWYEKNGRERTSDYMDVIVEWKMNNPEGVKAIRAIYRAVARGEIVKPKKCQQCGRKTRLSGHHEDYSKVFEVVWLCSSCHKRVHSGDLKLST